MTLAWQIVMLIWLSALVGAFGMYHYLRARGYIKTKYITKRRKEYKNKHYKQQKHQTH